MPRPSTGTGLTRIVEKFRAGGVENKSRWVRIVVKTVGTVACLPLVGKLLHLTRESFGAHEASSIPFMDMVAAIPGEWGVAVIFALIGITLLVPAIGLPVWNWGYKKWPAKWGGPKDRKPGA